MSSHLHALSDAQLQSSSSSPNTTPRGEAKRMNGGKTALPQLNLKPSPAPPDTPKDKRQLESKQGSKRRFLNGTTTAPAPPPSAGLSNQSDTASTGSGSPGAAGNPSGLPQYKQKRGSYQLGESERKQQPQTSRLPKSDSKPTTPRIPDTARVHQARVSTHSARSSRSARGTRPPSQRKPAERKKTLRVPMTPAETMKKFADKLTPFEQSEILEYQQIYFTGPNASKIKGIPHTANNNGYDDDRGDYRVTVNDHLEYRYEILSVLGRGSFGQVVKVLDHKKDAVLALKVIRNKKRFHHQALVEVKILEHLMGKDKEHKSNVVRVHGYFYFRNHLCITFEPLSMNLYEFIKNNNFKGVSLNLIRRFSIQLLQSLAFLKKERIIHCDLKPENVLLKSPNKSTIKLIDFGSSCFEDERVYTYIQSRFYRSPEVILGLPYDVAIDMWSFGCILSELYTGYPLFPGENEAEQIQCIMEILGTPPKRMINASTRKKTFFDANGKPLLVPNSRGKIRHPNTKDLSTATRCNDPQFLSFLRRCLRWDPKVRMTPDKAFEHPWITEGQRPRRNSGASSNSNPSQSGRSSPAGDGQSSEGGATSAAAGGAPSGGVGAPSGVVDSKQTGGGGGGQSTRREAKHDDKVGGADDGGGGGGGGGVDDDIGDRRDEDRPDDLLSDNGEMMAMAANNNNNGGGGHAMMGATFPPVDEQRLSALSMASSQFTDVINHNAMMMAGADGKQSLRVRHKKQAGSRGGFGGNDGEAEEDGGINTSHDIDGGGGGGGGVGGGSGGGMGLGSIVGADPNDAARSVKRRREAKSNKALFPPIAPQSHAVNNSNVLSNPANNGEQQPW